MNRCRRRGLSLVEVLITVAICGTLMTAVAVAFQATSQAMQSNERFLRAQQSARVALTQILAEARRCRSGVVTDDTFEMVTAAGETREYRFDADNQLLTMTPHVDLPPFPTVTLARNVRSATFDTAGNAITVRLVIEVDGHTIALSGSAVPRKTIQYR